MASTLTVKDSDNLCTFLASTSTVSPSYNATANDSNHSITLSFATDNTNPVISLAKDPSTGNYLENSLMVEINWAGRHQTVILVHPDAYGVEWTVGGTKLTRSTPSKQITSGSTIYAKSLRQAGAVPTQTATKVRIRGYWQTNTYPESTTGCYNKPSIIQVGVKYTVDWAEPDLSSYSASNKPVILGYMVVYWKGNWGASDGVTGIGDSVMVAPDVTSLTSNANWWSGVNGHHLKHTVFTIYNKGISPAISTAKAECLTERPTSSAGSGTGASVKNYSHYSKFDNSDTTQLYQVGFYLENGTSPVVVNNSDFISYQVAGSKVVTPTGSSWIPTNYHLSGWYRKDGTGSWQTTLLTNSAVKNIAVNNNIYFKAKFDPNTVNIVFKPNYPSGSSGSGTDVTKSWMIGSSQSLPAAPATPTKTGYTVTFAGWYDAASGGNAVPNPYTVPSSGKTFYAHWNQSINSYTLTTQVASASSGMGTVSGGGSKQYNASCTITATPITGYDFTKWVFTGGKTGESTSASTTFNMPAGDVTATAYFGVHNYVITYNLGSSDVVNPNPSTYTIEDENILLADPIRPGYVFLGWSPQGYIEAGSHGDMTFTANWFKEMDDFTPDPGHGANDNGNFGIDTDPSVLDPSGYYQLILEVRGDRANYPYEYTAGIDYTQYGISVEENKWSYDSGVITGEELKTLLEADSDPDNTDYIFPLDIWRCRINHSRGELTVTLNLYDSAGENIIGSTSKTKEFALKTDNKPHITKVELHEGVVNIKNLDLGANNQESTKRFVGNKKSSVLATVFASNLDGEGKELLYEAVPCQFIVRLDGINTGRADAQWDTRDIERILTQEQIAEFVESYNGGEMEYPCEDLLVTEEPFPSINSDLPNARLRIKIWDSRRE